MFDADILVFVVPYQYIHEICDKLRGKIKSSALAVSCVKVRRFLLSRSCHVIIDSTIVYK